MPGEALSGLRSSPITELLPGFSSRAPLAFAGGHVSNNPRRGRCVSVTGPAAPRRTSCLQRRHIDYETVFDVALEKPVVGRIDFLDADELDVAHDVVRGAKIEHFLGFGDAPDERAGKLPPSTP